VLLQGFFTGSAGVLVSTGVSDVPAGLGGAMRTFLAFVCVRCISRRCSHASSPRA
jgi:hypothetical protein